MRDADGQIVGIRLRHRDGRKCAVRGSSGGFMVGTRAGDLLLVTEGPTDAAAAICACTDAAVVGRPSCRGAEVALVEYVRMRKFQTVALLADQDAQGLAGARHAAEALALVHRDVRLIDSLPAKDVRELVKQRGADSAGSLLRELVAATAPVAIEIVWREVLA
jgi:hypothetical protein